MLEEVASVVASVMKTNRNDSPALSPAGVLSAIPPASARPPTPNPIPKHRHGQRQTP